jgi:hypothetical protein
MRRSIGECDAAFEMLQKAMSAGSDMNRQAIEEVAKVS